jgi:predicted N-formylglutamate amidohydrolase
MISATNRPALLPPECGPAASIVNPDGGSPVVLVCEHASRFIPPAMADLGLDETAKTSHAAWDIGAESLARHLAGLLDAPLVMSNVSRLVYDCNRPPDSNAAIPERSEVIEVPGNRNLDRAARAARIREIYRPFRALLRKTLQDRADPEPVLVTIHSFTPVYFGVPRQVELGLLHDADARLAAAMADAASGCTKLKTALNEPYGQADGVTHTLKLALPRGLLNVMIEVRNDFLGNEHAIANISRELAELVETGLEACRRQVQTPGIRQTAQTSGGRIR